jgi:hypothetical protein
MRRPVLITAAVALLVTGCTSASAVRAPSRPAAAPSHPVVVPSHPVVSSASRAAASPARSAARPSTHAMAGGCGRAVLAHCRVVAYYGAAGTARLGVLGASSPDAAAAGIVRRAAGFAGYGRRVQPAMELIATVAQRSPGRDGTYSKPAPAARVGAYLAAAHRHHMLLVLDLQPGRASFLAQARALRPFLLDPAVSLALDPEWKVGPHTKPGGGRIGASSAAGINAVGTWLSGLVRAHHLPDKLLVVHQFTASMLPDRSRIGQFRDIEMVLHADGFGTPTAKVRVLHRLAFPHPPFAVGFKLFLRQDSRLMSPAEVMALRPRPDVITYE